KNVVFIPFFNRASKVKDSYEIDTVHAPLEYGECTKSVLLVYRKGTKEVLQRYWRSTKELLNVCTFPVHQKYVKSRGAVQPTADYTESTVKSLRLIAYRLMLKIKCLQPIAYGLLLIFVSMFSLSDAWAQSAETRAAEGQKVGTVGHRIVPYTNPKHIEAAKADTTYDLDRYPFVRYELDTAAVLKISLGDTIPQELMEMPLRVVGKNTPSDTICLGDIANDKLVIQIGRAHV